MGMNTGIILLTVDQDMCLNTSAKQLYEFMQQVLTVKGTNLHVPFAVSD